jgi:hypothetical protein
MKYDIIQIKDYLLVVDASAKEINNGEYFLLGGSHINKWAGTGIRQMTHLSVKVIAHLPINGASILEGVDLLPPLNEEIPKLNLSKEEISELTFDGKSFISHAHVYYTAGYKEAREKYNLTLSKLVDMYIERTGYGMDMWSKEENETMSTIADIIESLNQPKLPIAFECETYEELVDGFGLAFGLDGYDEPVTEQKPKTIINFEGITQWSGKYIY